MRAEGSHWEQVALDYLSGQGLELLTKNYQCRFGEIDLIMRDVDTLSFVEVRYRHGADFGSGADSVGWHKQRRISAAASHFLQRRPAWAEHPCRFDVVSISGGRPPNIDWIKDAFECAF